MKNLQKIKLNILSLLSAHPLEVPHSYKRQDENKSMCIVNGEKGDHSYRKIKQKAMDADMTMTQYVLRATSEYMNK